MRRLSDRQRQLLLLLADGQFHPGPQIGEALGISRAAVSQQLKGLRELGVELHSVSGKGHRLALPLQLLDGPRLQQDLPEAPLQVLAVIDSTNQFMMSQLDRWQKGECVLAECQTAGRGRRGRQWHSPFGSQLILSLFWRLEQGMASAMGLSLVVGIALVEALESQGLAGIQVKWPNDLYLDGRKLAGILVEMAATVGGACQMVVGVGMNLQLPLGEAQKIDQPWAELQSLVAQGRLDRHQLTCAVVRQLRQCLARFEQEGMAPFVARWNALDLYRDQPVRLISGERSWQGIARGIDSQGALLLENDQGELQTLVGGEISLRPA